MPRVNPPTKDCAVKDCDRGAVKRQWCRKHYNRWLAHGDPNVVLRPSRNFPRCPICYRRKITHEDTGLCDVHHQQHLDHGDAFFDGGNYPECSHMGCHNMAVSRRLCNRHYRKLLQFGDPDAPDRHPERLPADPLLDYIDRLGGPSAVMSRKDELEFERFDARLDRAKELGTVQVWIADEICCEVLGVHPYAIFGEDWWTDHDIEEEVADAA